MVTDNEYTTEEISAKLTAEEYEWLVTREWSTGVRNGRREMKDTILALLKTYCGDLFSSGNDGDAEFVRDLRKMIIDKVEL